MGKGITLVIDERYQRPFDKNRFELAGEHVQGLAAELDVIRPGWQHQVNLGMLDFGSNRFCLIGQLWGHVRHCPHWGRLSNRYPRAVCSFAALPFWEEAVTSRGGDGKCQTVGMTFVPPEWEQEFQQAVKVVNGQHRLAALASLDVD